MISPRLKLRTTIRAPDDFKVSMGRRAAWYTTALGLVSSVRPRTIPNIMSPAKATEGKRKKRKAQGGQIRALKESHLAGQIALFRSQNELLNEQLQKREELLKAHTELIEEQRGVGGAEAGPSLPKLEAGGPKAKQKKRKREPTEASPPKAEAKRRKRKEAEASPHEPNENEAHCARTASIVAAVVFKALYDKAKAGPPIGAHKKTALRIRNSRKRFREFGCKKPEELDGFVDLWVSTMKERNTAAHKIGPEDVISMLLHCEPTLRGVLERAFSRFWDIPVGDWDRATPDRRSRTFEF
ncbi:hypothetical protein C7212DRAFT_342353 [Tuber magnatum]|uniref:Uncharacterized protein n=1 Tax=Tuber magnatum TaxID=42249 RepID=A0A317SUB9_9PEZI|nr:hypothetical protein C7212DRAFT_342353 [Tuber magnatum]